MKTCEIIEAVRNADLEGIREVTCKTKDLVTLVNYIGTLERSGLKLTKQVELLQSSIVKAANTKTVYLDELV